MPMWAMKDKASEDRPLPAHREIMDRFAMSAAVGAAGIRLGNFLNSEIVGRPAGEAEAKNAPTTPATGQAG